MNTRSTRSPIPRGRARALLVAVLLALLHPWVQADPIRLWPRDMPVSTAPGDQGLLRPIVVPDGQAGVFVVWNDRIRGTVRLKRLGSDGHPLWAAPIPPATTAWGKFEPAAIADGAGGLFIAWAEGRSGGCFIGAKVDCDIYAQHLDGDGNRLWSNQGRPVVRAAGNQGASGISLARDGAGGIYVAWEDARPDCCKVYLQRLGSDGTRLWPAGGLRLSPEPFIVFGPLDIAPQVIADGAGGALVAWIDNQVNPSTERVPLRVQKVDATANRLWGDYGIRVGFPNTVFLSMVPDGAGGALLAFTLSGLIGLHDVAAQRVAADGSLPWGEDGVRVATPRYSADTPVIVRDRRGGALVAWIDHVITAEFDEESDIRAQRVSPAGVPLWQPRGRAISTAAGIQDNLHMIPDGRGGAFLFWRDCRDYPELLDCHAQADIFGQHLYHDGSPLWRTHGAPITTAAGNQGVGQGTPIRASSIAAVPIGRGGAILAWPDGRRAPCDNAIWLTECDVRAQRIADAP